MNILIINPDQMRHDYATHAGHPFINTQHLSRLASLGTPFLHAYTTCPMCAPARTSMITGKYPIEHGVRNYGPAFNPQLPNALTNLGNAGYRRALFGKDHIAQPNSSPFGPFYDEGEDICLGNMDAHPDYQFSFSSGPLDKSSPFNITERLTTSAIDFIRRQHAANQKFFVTVNFQDPHPYFTCPEPYASLFHPDQFSMPPNFRTHPAPGEPTRLSLWRTHSAHHQATDLQMRQLMAIYCGQIRYVDDQIGRLLHTLESLRILDQTLIFFWSDHGEYLNDFGVTHKQATFYDSLIRVPMVLFDPTNTLSKRPVHSLVETIDAMATLLDLANVPQPQGSRAHSLASPNYQPRTDVFADAGLYQIPPTQPLPGVTMKAAFAPTSLGPGAMLRTATHKLCASALDTWELFDMRSDPHETTNLFHHPAHQQIRDQLTTRLMQRLLCLGQPPEYMPRF